MVATTELVQIDIPQEFIKLAGEWYSNQDDMLYAVSSAGEVTLGDRTPLNEETWLLMTPQEHHSRPVQSICIIGIQNDADGGVYLVDEPETCFYTAVERQYKNHKRAAKGKKTLLIKNY